MKLAVFLIGLCLVLMCGADRVFAGKHSKSCCYTRTYHHEMEGKRTISSITAENTHLFIDSLEEDRDDLETRKFNRAIRYHSSLSYQALLSCLDNLFDTAPPYWPQESDKYILQRVFRV